MARPHPALVSLAAGSALPEIGDHGELLRSAIEHRMTGLLWSRVDEAAAGAPPGWRSALASEDLQNRALNQALWSALEESTAMLHGAGIEVATVKGVTAEARWYDRAGERPCGDLDLVLDPRQLDHVDDAVELLQPGHPLLGRLAPMAAAGALSSVELRTARGCSIDLHFDALKLGVRSRARHALWDRTLAFELPNGGEVRVLDAESSLLLFLVHANKDRFRNLLGFVDVGRVVARDQVDWAGVEGLARRDGIEVPVRRSWQAIAGTLGLEDAVPPALGWRASAWDVLWRPSIRLRGAEGVVRFRNRQLALVLLARGRTLEGLRVVFRRAFPRADLLRYRRPESTGPYPWRLLRTRVTSWRQQRRAVSGLRRRAPRDRPRVAVPTRHDG